MKRIAVINAWITSAAGERTVSSFVVRCGSGLLLRSAERAEHQTTRSSTAS